MKFSTMLKASLLASGLMAASLQMAAASEVLYDGTGIFVGQQSFQDGLYISGPGTLTVTLTNDSWPSPLANLSFVVSSTQNLLGPEMSAGTATYQITSAENVFVQAFGTAQGPLNTGAYGLEVQFAPLSPVPLPTTLATLLSGLVLLAWHRRQRQTQGLPLAQVANMPRA
jgi:hypothetical protein